VCRGAEDRRHDASPVHVAERSVLPRVAHTVSSAHSADDLKRVAATLNRRPRPTLDLQTPANRLAQLLTAA
jgi:IS30 family transposase